MVLYMFMCNADYELHRIENDVYRVNEVCLGIIMLVFLIMHCNLCCLHGSTYVCLSLEAQTLLKQILQFRPLERISINNMLHHRWTLGETAGFNAFALLEAEEEEVRVSMNATNAHLRKYIPGDWVVAH